MSERVVVLTGARGGIGRAPAVAFGRRRDKVALLTRGQNGLDGAVVVAGLGAGQASRKSGR